MNLPEEPAHAAGQGDRLAAHSHHATIVWRASPILANLGGPESPRSWQGALPFTYHVGPGPVKVHLLVKLAYHYATIWDVIGIVKGSAVAE